MMVKKRRKHKWSSDAIVDRARLIGGSDAHGGEKRIGRNHSSETSTDDYVVPGVMRLLQEESDERLHGRGRWEAGGNTVMSKGSGIQLERMIPTLIREHQEGLSSRALDIDGMTRRRGLGMWCRKLWHPKVLVLLRQCLHDAVMRAKSKHDDEKFSGSWIVLRSSISFAGGSSCDKVIY